MAIEKQVGKVVPNLIDLLVYRTIKAFDDAREHASLGEIGEVLGLNISTVSRRVDRLEEAGLVYRRVDAGARNIRLTNDPDADIMIVNDGDMDFEVSESLLVKIDVRKGMLIFVSDECLAKARDELDKRREDV